MQTCEDFCKNPLGYVEIALAIEILAYHNKNYLWTGDDCKISKTVQSLLWEAIDKNKQVLLDRDI